MAIHAYYLDDPKVEVSQNHLTDLGVIHWHLDANNYEKEGKLDQICKERGYNYRDFVNSQKMPDLKSKLANFLEEHLHDDEEIRFFIDGSGYFDIRDGKDTRDPWIRMECKKGDIFILPAGIYHRFVPDDNMFFHVMRLFCGEPVWTPYNRVDPKTEERTSRIRYVNSFLKTTAVKI